MSKISPGNNRKYTIAEEFMSAGLHIYGLITLSFLFALYLFPDLKSMSGKENFWLEKIFSCGLVFYINFFNYHGLRLVWDFSTYERKIATIIQSYIFFFMLVASLFFWHKINFS